MAEKTDVYASLFSAIPGMHDFWYDGRTDGQPHVSPAEWARRRAAWDTTTRAGLLVTGKPLVLTAVEESGPVPDRALCIEHQPSLQDRAALVAREALRREGMNRLNALDGPACDDVGDHVHRISRLLDVYAGHARSPQGQAELQERTILYKSALVPHLDIEDLCRPLEARPWPSEALQASAPAAALS